MVRPAVTVADPSPAIEAYVDALLVKWPDLGDEGGEESPWSDGPLINNATGPIVYFGMSWAYADAASTFSSELAAKHGLVCFDPQTESLRP